MWTTEVRRRYAQAIQEMVRQGMLVRLAATIDAIHPLSVGGRGLADPGRAPGFVACRTRRSRLATTAASLAAAPDRMEPSQQLATAGGVWTSSWERLSRTLPGSGGEEGAVAAEAGAVVHLPIQQLETSDLPLGLAAAPRRGQRGTDRDALLLQPRREGFHNPHPRSARRRTRCPTPRAPRRGQPFGSRRSRARAP